MKPFRSAGGSSSHRADLLEAGRLAAVAKGHARRVAGGLALIFLVPRFTTAIPAPLVAIVVLTVGVVVGAVDVPTVGDEGALPDALPILGIPAVPFSLETLTIVAPYSLTLAAVGLLESLMTAKLVDDITETKSDKERETRGQGIANVVTGLFGGMAGCAMVGQTIRATRRRQLIDGGLPTSSTGRR